ncbi:MAG: MFS transporter [Rhodobacteraceae bacterium]|jgi:DHA1 family tetracycline resistance protein-like MFS transporter|nr:MAG: MFS transporter [Paracoccaceae bacterium]|tara:strand:- start:497 stop:1729 length:1233 start_codon:yes stop_codon:yes gene_type:complete
MNKTNLPIKIIIFTVILDSVGIGIMIPVLPSLMTDVLPGKTVAEAAVWGGILASIFAVMQFICGPILGSLSDTFGRRPVILVSLIFMAFDYIIMGLATSVWMLLFGRVLGGITASTHSTAAAYVADISSSEQKAARFGYIGAGFGIGFVLGPIIGGLLGEIGPRIPFFAAAIVSALNAAACYFFLPESLKNKNVKQFLLRNINPFNTFKVITKFDSLKVFLLVFLLYSISTAVYAAIWPYFTAERFSWSPGMIGLSLTVYGLCFAFIQGVLVQPTINLIGRYNTVLLGFGTEIVAMVLIAIITNGWFLIALTPLASLGVIGQPALTALMSDQVDERNQGSLQGVISSLTALSMIITPLSMTWILAQFSNQSSEIYFPGAPFIASAILLTICVSVFLFWAPKNLQVKSFKN